MHSRKIESAHGTNSRRRSSLTLESQQMVLLVGWSRKKVEHKKAANIIEVILPKKAEEDSRCSIPRGILVYSTTLLLKLIA